MQHDTGLKADLARLRPFAAVFDSFLGDNALQVDV